MATPIILTKETLASPRAGYEMAAALAGLTTADATPLDGFRIMLSSASSARAAGIGRAQIEAHYHKVLTAALRGEHAAERAALVLSIVAGVQVMRQMIGLSALAKCPPETLVKILGTSVPASVGKKALRTARKRQRRVLDFLSAMASQPRRSNDRLERD